MTTTEIAKTTIAFTISRIIVGFNAINKERALGAALTFPRRFAKAKSPFMSRGSSAHSLQPVRRCTGREALLSSLNFSQKAVSLTVQYSCAHKSSCCPLLLGARDPTDISWKITVDLSPVQKSDKRDGVIFYSQAQSIVSKPNAVVAACRAKFLKVPDFENMSSSLNFRNCLPDTPEN